MPFPPAPFYSTEFDFKKIRQHFIHSGCEFFRSLFFTFAPLMTIPFYNEPRPERDSSYSCESISEAELETMVSHMGCEYFKHPESCTQNILLVRNFCDHGQFVTATVYAQGCKGIQHVEYIPRSGRDGKIHHVPVPWIEYIPVSHQTYISAARKENFDNSNATYSRRGIIIW